MRKLTVKNILGHSDLECSFAAGANLVTGPNSAGKTSIARILAAVTTHNTNPSHLSATMQKAYVRRGCSEGTARIEGGAEWDAGRGAIGIGNNARPEAVPETVGLVDFSQARTALKARVALFENIFGEPDAESLLKSAWGEFSSAEESRKCASALKIVREDGWDKAAESFEELKREAGRSWRQTTGDIYSKKKATNWRPDGFRSEIEGVSEDDVMQALADANEAMRAFEVQEAVSADQIERGMRARFEEIPSLDAEIAIKTDKINEILEEIKFAEGQVEEVKKAISESVRIKEKVGMQLYNLERMIEELDQDPPYSCPGCGMGLVLLGGPQSRLHEWEKKDPSSMPEKIKQAKKLKNVYKDSCREVEKTKESLHCHGQILSDTQVRLREANEEKSFLMGQRNGLEKTASLADADVSEGNDAERSALESARETALKDISAFQAYAAAQTAHENYVEYERIAKLLGPAGARKEWMDSKMNLVKTALSNISKKAGWLPIEITSSYEITSDGMPISLAAENERRKAQWALQVAVAMLRKDNKWIVLDAADLLRGDSWNGLVNVVNAITAKRPDVTVVVCATESECPEGWNPITI